MKRDGVVSYKSNFNFTFSNDFYCHLSRNNDNSRRNANSAQQTQVSHENPRRSAKRRISSLINALRQKRRQMQSTCGEVEQFTFARSALCECARELTVVRDDSSVVQDQ